MYDILNISMVRKTGQQPTEGISLPQSEPAVPQDLSSIFVPRLFAYIPAWPFLNDYTSMQHTDAIAKRKSSSDIVGYVEN